jgi:putative addiction module CopG family antidote
MSTTIELTPRSEEFIKAQLASGRYHSPEEVVERALEAMAQKTTDSSGSGPRVKTATEAVADIMELRKGLRLNGLKIRDMINEGRKY